MESIRASICWDGPHRDILFLFREPTPEPWIADFDEIIANFSVLRVIDDHDQETGEIAGFEIADFLKFDRWPELPDLPVLWQAPEREPLRYQDLLQRVQSELRSQTKDNIRSA